MVRATGLIFSWLGMLWLQSIWNAAVLASWHADVGGNVTTPIKAQFLSIKYMVNIQRLCKYQLVLIPFIISFAFYS